MVEYLIPRHDEPLHMQIRLVYQQQSFQKLTSYQEKK